MHDKQLLADSLGRRLPPASPAHTYPLLADDPHRPLETKPSVTRPGLLALAAEALPVGAPLYWASAADGAAAPVATLASKDASSGDETPDGNPGGGDDPDGTTAPHRGSGHIRHCERLGSQTSRSDRDEDDVGDVQQVRAARVRAVVHGLTRTGRGRDDRPRPARVGPHTKPGADMPNNRTHPNTTGRRVALPPVFDCSWTSGGTDAAWVRVAGEVDIATTPRLERVLQEALLWARLVVLDLRDLAFMESSGVHAIVGTGTHARQTGRRVVVLRGPRDVDRVFAATGTSADLELHDVDAGQPSDQVLVELAGRELVS